MDELSRVALVGTLQAGPGLPDTEPALGPLFSALAPASRERELLLRAGAAAVYRRAGRAPLRVESLPAPAPVETLRACGPALTALLRALLDGAYRAVLPEALDRMRGAGLRLAPELLPDALDVHDRHLRERLRPVLGERGRWLARLEPGWAWASSPPPGDRLPADADARWQEGRPDERLALLALARRVDVDRSRAWLAATWSSERAQYRGDLLAVLETGLGPGDEPLLLTALADRSAPVRLAAARLLWRLPGSALAATMRGRAEALLVHHDGRTGLDVRLPPESFDPAWADEGLVEEPPAGREIGRRQWWLAQTIAAVPPAHWERRLSAPAATLVAAAAAHEFCDVLIDGLTTAALAHGSSAWIEPLWQVWLARPRPDAPVTALRSALLARMDEPARARRACELLASGAEDIGALAALDPPWPASVADAFLSAFARPLSDDGAHPWEGMLGAAALAMPASHLDRALPEPAEPGRRLRRLIDEFHAVLHFRRRLHEEIRREHAPEPEQHPS
jgi:Family of unknown function (DUF5691)